MIDLIDSNLFLSKLIFKQLISKFLGFLKLETFYFNKKVFLCSKDSKD